MATKAELMMASVESPDIFEPVKAELGPRIKAHIWNGRDEVLYRIMDIESFRHLVRLYPSYKGFFDISIVDFADMHLRYLVAKEPKNKQWSGRLGQGMLRFNKKYTTPEGLSIGTIGTNGNFVINEKGQSVSPLFTDHEVSKDGLTIRLMISPRTEVIILKQLDKASKMKILGQRECYESAALAIAQREAKLVNKVSQIE